MMVVNFPIPIWNEGGALRCWVDTSLRHLPDDNLNQLNKRRLLCALQRWSNRK